MMKRVSIFTLLLTLLVLLIGCDNGSVSSSAVSDGLVKVCLTVGDESSSVQKSISASGSEWSSYTYQYNAVPQWIDPQGTPIHGATSWIPINYSTGMSLGYFAPGQWVFGVRIKNGATVVYEGYSEVIEVKNASVNVDVLVNKLVTNAVVGSVRIAVTAPAEEDDTLSISYSGTSSGGPFTVTAEYDSAKYPFEYTVPGLTAGTYTFTLTHSVGSVAGSIDVTLASGEMAVISGHLDNGRWQLEYYTVKVYTVTAASASHGSVQVNTEFAAVGDRVSFYPKPVSGSTLISVSVTCGGNPVTFTYSEKMYSFTMPDGNVTVSATFDVVDTSINLSHFKTILKAFYDSNPGVTAFGRSAVEPSGVEYLGIKDVKIWYDSTLTKICWYSGAGNEITFNNDDTSMADLFKDCIKYVDISMEGIKTANITDMSHMFDGCVNLQFVDVSGFDTSLVQDMSYMFNHAGYSGINMAGKGQYLPNNFYLQITGLDDFNTESVRNMSYMFHTCSAQTLDVSSFNPKQCTDFSYMFSGEYTGNYANFWYTKFTALDVSGWQVGGQVANNAQIHLEHMFDMVQKLTGLVLTDDASDENKGWKFTKVVDMNSMFNRCEDIESIVFPKHTDLTNVTSLLSVFCRDAKIQVGSGNGDGKFQDIFSRWDIRYNDYPSTGGKIEFTDFPTGYPTGGDSPNRIIQGDTTALNRNTPYQFETYGGQWIEIGGKINSGTNDEKTACQRLKKIATP